MPLAQLCHLSVTSPATCKCIGPFWCWFPGGWVCVCSRTLWIPPKDSPVRLGVSLATTTPSDFYRFFKALCLCVGTLSCSVCLIPQLFLPQALSAPSCPSPSLLPVWMNVSSLTPWLSDFHTVQYSGRSVFFFLIGGCCVFWLYEKVKCIYLCLHLGQNSRQNSFKNQELVQWWGIIGVQAWKDRKAELRPAVGLFLLCSHLLMRNWWKKMSCVGQVRQKLESKCPQRWEP